MGQSFARVHFPGQIGRARPKLTSAYHGPSGAAMDIAEWLRKLGLEQIRGGVS